MEDLDILARIFTLQSHLFINTNIPAHEEQGAVSAMLDAAEQMNKALHSYSKRSNLSLSRGPESTSEESILKLFTDSRPYIEKVLLGDNEWKGAKDWLKRIVLFLPPDGFFNPSEDITNITHQIGDNGVFTESIERHPFRLTLLQGLEDYLYREKGLRTAEIDHVIKCGNSLRNAAGQYDFAARGALMYVKKSLPHLNLRLLANGINRMAFFFKLFHEQTTSVLTHFKGRRGIR